MNHEEWLACRKRGITGTDVAAICGLSRWKAPIDVWLDKTGRSEPFPDNPRMYWGRRLEAEVAGWYEERTGRRVVEPDPKLVVGPEAWILGSPDRIVVGEPRGLEIKTAGERSAHRWGEDGSQLVPEEYTAQVAWYMLACRYPRWDLAALIGGQDARLYEFERDADYEDLLREAAGRFWRDYVLADVPPAVDGSDSWAAYLQRAFPAPRVTDLAEATPEVMAAAARLRAARAAMAAAQADEALAANEIKAFIGERAGVLGLGFVITWKAPRPTRVVDWRAVATDACATDGNIASHTSERPGARRFLPKFDDAEEGGA